MPRRRYGFSQPSYVPRRNPSTPTPSLSPRLSQVSTPPSSPDWRFSSQSSRSSSNPYWLENQKRDRRVRTIVEIIRRNPIVQNGDIFGFLNLYLRPIDRFRTRAEFIRFGEENRLALGGELNITPSLPTPASQSQESVPVARFVDNSTVSTEQSRINHLYSQSSGTPASSQSTTYQPVFGRRPDPIYTLFGTSNPQGRGRVAFSQQSRRTGYPRYILPEYKVYKDPPGVDPWASNEWRARFIRCERLHKEEFWGVRLYLRPGFWFWRIRVFKPEMLKYVAIHLIRECFRVEPILSGKHRAEQLDQAADDLAVIMFCMFGEYMNLLNPANWKDYFLIHLRNQAGIVFKLELVVRESRTEPNSIINSRFY